MFVTGRHGQIKHSPLREELELAPARVLARFLLPVGLDWPWGDEFAVARAAGRALRPR